MAVTIREARSLTVEERDQVDSLEEKIDEILTKEFAGTDIQIATQRLTSKNEKIHERIFFGLKEKYAGDWDMEQDQKEEQVPVEWLKETGNLVSPRYESQPFHVLILKVR